MFGRARTPCRHYPCGNLSPCATHPRIPFAGAKSAESYGPRWRALSRAYLKRHPMCELCGVNPSAHADHIEPRQGPQDDVWEKIQAACRPCHSRKTGSEARARRVGMRTEEIEKSLKRDAQDPDYVRAYAAACAQADALEQEGVGGS